MFAALSDQLDASNKKFVLRNGQTLELPDAEIVVGDIVTFNAHNAASVPADGVLVSGSGVKMDEAALNGEPEPAEKSAEKPFILSGTVCTSGSGKLLVLAVGTHSVSGKIKAAVYGEAEEGGGSPLFDKLDKMSLKIGKARRGVPARSLPEASRLDGVNTSHTGRHVRRDGRFSGHDGRGRFY